MRPERRGFGTILVLLCGALPVWAQEGAAEAPSVQVEDLRGRIREMRMSLILGGDNVQRAESEAIDFYNQKIDTVDQRMDSLDAELTEKRAVYDLALDNALAADQDSERESTMLRAQELRAEITALEGEEQELDGKRDGLNGLVRGVEQRGLDREKLAAKLATVDNLDEGVGLTLGAVGLAPPAVQGVSGSPLDDDRMIQDLLDRDPRRARELLFKTDPAGYWRRFPLRPPTEALQGALAFPLPDLPGRR